MAPNHSFTGILTVQILAAIIAAASTALRFYVRATYSRIAADDWVLLVGVLAFVSSNGLTTAFWFNLQSTGLVAGTHFAGVLAAVNIFLYLLAEVLVRAAYCLFYLTTIPRELDLAWQRCLLLISFALYAAFGLATGFLYVFQCGSPKNIDIAGAVCIDFATLEILFDVVYYLDACLDWLMVLIPMTVVFKSTMDKRTKLSVLSVLAFGCIASALAVAAIPLLHAEISGHVTIDRVLRLLSDIYILATLETMVAIVCLTLLTLKPLLRRWFEGQDRGPSQVPIMLDNSELASPRLFIAISNTIKV